MRKRFAEPKDHWNWPIKVTHKQGVRCGQMIWMGGQTDTTAEGIVNHPGDLARQTANSIANMGRVLGEIGCDFADLVKLLCFYVNDGGVQEADVLAMIAAALPRDARPAITLVPVAWLCYPGMVVEIEGYAMRGEDDARLPRSYADGTGLSPLPPAFAPALRCGRMIFVSAQSPVDAAGHLLHAGDIVAQTKQVMQQVGRALGAFGADYDDVVKINRWYVGAGKVEDFEPAALACAAHFKEPGPAATGVPLPRHAIPGQQIKIEVVAMLGEDGQRLKRRHVWPEGLWDWTIHLPYHHGLKCHDMIFLGGQVSLNQKGETIHVGDMQAQTRQAMTHIGTILKALGADYRDICKITTVYAGKCGYDELHENLSVRSSFFQEPGPATTGIPLPVLAYPAMSIEIDAFAMAEPDR
ncbi:enamine deaminase RidA (YjgF/YER057c/UK114 family) [Dongia mobilis]|uniref:Enamine deaminase RidA (YjgF/YER057c/UK114 family) n=1 Tax=Dongia mobilis TaxID=578943 RepID=A0A4R6WXZ1_9PROT|nr:RidA family protein [Dongia mobilis]TDQ82495.1 enamine deaminase RidA (YjgF/YER057c/UK114 family) [Dongia mobilis]